MLLVFLSVLFDCFTCSTILITNINYTMLTCTLKERVFLRKKTR